MCSSDLYLQHLGALFKVTSDIDHTILAKEILVAIFKFQDNAYISKLSTQILGDPKIRESLKALLRQLQANTETNTLDEAIALFRPLKRGRRPSFAKTKQVGMMEQVSFLGGFAFARAS